MKRKTSSQLSGSDNIAGGVGDDEILIQGERSVIVETNQGTIKTGDEIHHYYSSALTDKESVLEAIKIQNEIAILDREWVIESEKHPVKIDVHSTPTVPKRMPVFRIVVFSVLCVVLALIITLGFAVMSIFLMVKSFGLFLIVFLLIIAILWVLISVAEARHHNEKVRKYKAAHDAYLQRREELLARLKSMEEIS
jgi:hypothetical protein